MDMQKNMRESANSALELAGLLVKTGVLEVPGKLTIIIEGSQGESVETPRQRFDRIKREAQEDVLCLMDECFFEGAQVSFQDFPEKDGGNWSDYDEQYRDKPHTYACVRDVVGEEREGVAAVSEGDTYSKSIGRAIALRRAMGKHVPQKYLIAGALLKEKPEWEKRPAKLGDTIRVTKDNPNGAMLKKGDILLVMSCLPFGAVIGKHPGKSEPWAVGVEDYEVKNV